MSLFGEGEEDDFIRGEVLSKSAGRIGRPISLESVESITPLASLDVPTRLEEFRRLEDGWLEGYGLAPDNAGLDWLSNIFQRGYPVDLPLPYLYPTFTGGVVNPVT